MQCVCCCLSSICKYLEHYAEAMMKNKRIYINIFYSDMNSSIWPHNQAYCFNCISFCALPHQKRISACGGSFVPVLFCLSHCFSLLGIAYSLLAGPCFPEQNTTSFSNRHKHRPLESDFNISYY